LAPVEDLLAEIPVVSNPVEPLSDDWLDDFAFDDKNSGIGDDGGQFEFAAFDDDNPFTDNQPTENENENENDTKKDDLDTSETLVTQLIKLDDPLQTIEKPKEKINKKGQTMAAMQSKQTGLTGKFDDNFLQTINAGLNKQPTPVQNSQPPQTNDLLSFNNKPSGLGNPNQPNPFSRNNVVTPAPMFNLNDPFMVLGGPQMKPNTANNGPIPATYQKPAKNDPFTSLSWK